jgi:hypothetical protein
VDIHQQQPIVVKGVYYICYRKFDRSVAEYNFPVFFSPEKRQEFLSGKIDGNCNRFYMEFSGK